MLHTVDKVCRPTSPSLDTGVRDKGFLSSKAELSKLSSHPSGVRRPGWVNIPGFASLNPGLMFSQPSGLRFPRRRRGSKSARGERAKRATPGMCFTKIRTPKGCDWRLAI
jgi:hypothetical protein